MDTPSTLPLFYAINLERAADRRQKLMQQAAEAGIELRIVPAYAGASLTDEDMAGYDRAKRHREYSEDLIPNEIGCVLSHLCALREFVATGEPYAIIMEDDVVFTPVMKEALGYIIDRTAGWQVVKLFSRRGKTYDITPAGAPADAPVRFIFPKKIYWAAVAMLYTREAAQRILELCTTYWLAWDAQVSYLLLEHDIPYCAIDPDIIDTTDSDNAQSTIGDRKGGKHFDSIWQYLRRRLGVIHASRRKAAMRRLMQKTLTMR